MPGNPHLELYVLLSFDLDRFVEDLERNRTIRRKVAAGRIESLEEQILYVRTCVCESPCDTVVASQRDEGHSWKRCANAVQFRRMHVREIPNGGCRQGKVRIVGKQWFAGFASAAANDPV